MVATFTSRPDLIQVTYKVLSDKIIDPEKKAKTIALEQTTGAWIPQALTEQTKLSKHRGAVLGIDERTHVLGRPYEYYLTIGFPPQNTEGDIPSLLTMIFGKISMSGKIRIESIEFPKTYLAGKGPRYGMSGLREKVGEPQKPLAMAIFKPCVGLTPKELGDMFYELACGGMHLVKDDEILPDLSICPTEKRLEECLKAGDRVKTEKGQTTLYAVNLTGPAHTIVSKAKKLAQQGAQCFLFNVLSYGYGLCEELRDVGVPIMAHPALAGALCGSSETGMSYAVVLGSLMRLAGADIVLFPSSHGTAAPPLEETKAIVRALTEALPRPPPLPAGGRPLPSEMARRASRIEVNFRRSFPAPSAGIHPGLIPDILRDYGPDVIINAGGGVHGHPGGARAGARAFRQGINWVVKRGSFAGISEREFPELAQALRHWGTK